MRSRIGARSPSVRTAAVLCLAFVTTFATLMPEARADVAIPATAELPARLTLDEAIRTFRARGFELLIAQAQVASAQGDEQIAGAIQNPVLSGAYGRVLGYDNSHRGHHFQDEVRVLWRQEDEQDG